MRKLFALIATVTLLVAGLVTPASAAPVHNIKPVSFDQSMKAWDVLDTTFKKRPATQKSFEKQGSRISVVGFSKTPTKTYPMRSIATKGGYWVYTVSPAGRDIKLSPKQFKDLTKVLPKCKRETSLNCTWTGSKQGNKRGKNIVNFPSVQAVQR